MDNQSSYHGLNTETTQDRSDWKTRLITVTPFSRAVALVLFVVLPFLGFWIGFNFGSISGSEQKSAYAVYDTQDQKSIDTNSIGVVDVQMQDWEQYRNEEYGFSFQYPESWELRDRTDIKEEPTVGLSSSDGSGVSILPAGGFAYGFDPAIDRMSRKITIDGKSALRADYSYDDELHTSRIVFDPKLEQFPKFRIDFRASKKQNNVEVFEKILNTFEFFEPLDISNWQTYRNEKFGYEVHFPEEHLKFNPMFKFPTMSEVVSEKEPVIVGELVGNYKPAGYHPFGVAIYHSCGDVADSDFIEVGSSDDGHVEMSRCVDGMLLKGIIWVQDPHKEAKNILKEVIHAFKTIEPT